MTKNNVENILQAYPWSELTKLLVRVIALNKEKALKIDDWYTIQSEVEDWLELDENADEFWAVEIMKNILEETEMPKIYLKASQINSLTGFLAEIERPYLIGYKDSGESVDWKLSNNMYFYISRESGDSRVNIFSLNKQKSNA